MEWALRWLVCDSDYGDCNGLQYEDGGSMFRRNAGNFYQTKLRHITTDRYLWRHGCETLKSQHNMFSDLCNKSSAIQCRPRRTLVASLLKDILDLKRLHSRYLKINWKFKTLKEAFT
jgi:hypothetical protein